MTCRFAVVLFLISCGIEQISHENAVCRVAGVCEDIYTQNLLEVSAEANNDALREYLIDKDNIGDSPFREQNDEVSGNLDSLLRGVNIAKKVHNINPVFALALSIHESGWGRSRIAMDKNNLWGWGAKDSCPYDCAREFSTYGEGFNLVYARIKLNYLTEGGDYFHACGNKKSVRCASNKLKETRSCGASLAGMNCNYASDPNWGSIIRNLMDGINKFLEERCVNFPT